jgi:hypothetical protein
LSKPFSHRWIDVELCEDRRGNDSRDHCGGDRKRGKDHQAAKAKPGKRALIGDRGDADDQAGDHERHDRHANGIDEDGADGFDAANQHQRPWRRRYRRENSEENAGRQTGENPQGRRVR